MIKSMFNQIQLPDNTGNTVTAGPVKLGAGLTALPGLLAGKIHWGEYVDFAESHTRWNSVGDPLHRATADSAGSRPKIVSQEGVR